MKYFIKLLEFVADHIEIIGMGIGMLIAVAGIHRKRQKEELAKRKLKEVQDNNIIPMTLYPQIDPAICAGCGSCVTACPEGEILQLVNHKAALVNPMSCVGHGLCAQSCPVKAITLVVGSKSRGVDIPNTSEFYETDVPGLYLAGEIGGMGLISNAVKQGAIAAGHAAKSIKKKTVNNVDTQLLVVGAGPAGISSALKAIEAKVPYMLIEQKNFGGTIYNFPRQKLVMTHPAHLPIVGEMKFPKNHASKEQLLEYLDEIRKKTRLKVHEGVKFLDLKKEGDKFIVDTSSGKITAAKVIISIGVRGSPRKLNVPGEDNNTKVTYNLIDPAQYRDKQIVVVGGGNAAAEAAQMLSASKLKNRVLMLIRGTTFDRCNEENRVKCITRAEKGKMDIWYSSQVQKISDTSITVVREGKTLELKNDFVFIFAGAELPFEFLKKIGVKIEKKFGETLGNKSSTKDKQAG